MVQPAEQDDTCQAPGHVPSAWPSAWTAHEFALAATPRTPEATANGQFSFANPGALDISLANPHQFTSGDAVEAVAAPGHETVPQERLTTDRREGSCSTTHEEPQVVDTSMPRTEGQSNDHRHLRVVHLHVTSLLADNTLGLLLHGTTVVGFRLSEARDVGWCIGDQILEVAGHTVDTFDQFMEHFQEAQLHRGFPIQFSVLRHEDQLDADVETAAEDTLQNFFNNTDFANLTSQLRENWRSQPTYSEPDSKGLEEPFISRTSTVRDTTIGDGSSRSFFSTDPSSAFSSEHPFVTALNLRRNALLRSSAGWAKYADDDSADHCDSIASRLAQRQDGVSTLYIAHEPDKEDRFSSLPVLHSHKSCSWFCSTSYGGSRVATTVDYELAPTPRVEPYPSDFRCGLEVEPPWLSTAGTSKRREVDCAGRELPPSDTPPESAAQGASEDGEDFDIMVPRKPSKGGSSCKGTVEAKVQALLLGNTSLP